MNLPFFSADTLGMTLYAVRAGLAAKEIHQIPLGPWQVDLTMDVKSDLMTGSAISFWVTANALRLYLVVREKENWLFVLDEVKLRECGLQTGFINLSITGRITEIKPAIVAAFRWQHEVWSQVKYDGGSPTITGG